MFLVVLAKWFSWYFTERYYRIFTIIIFFWEQYPFYDVGFGFPPTWSYSITKVYYVSGQQKAVVYERNMPII